MILNKISILIYQCHLKYRISIGFEIKYFNEIASLHLAVHKGNKEIIQCLINHKGIKSDIEDTILICDFHEIEYNF